MQIDNPLKVFLQEAAIYDKYFEKIKLTREFLDLCYVMKTTIEHYNALKPDCSEKKINIEESKKVVRNETFDKFNYDFFKASSNNSNQNFIDVTMPITHDVTTINNEDVNQRILNMYNADTLSTDRSLDADTTSSDQNLSVFSKNDDSDDSVDSTELQFDDDDSDEPDEEKSIKDQQDFEKLLDNQQKAKQNDPKAMYDVAEHYYPFETALYHKKAYELYVRATELNYADAYVGVGKCYENGKGVSKDYSQARCNYEIAHHLGSAIGTYNLARCWKYGIGVIADEFKMIEYMTLAAERGFGEAQLQLAVHYDNQKDYKVALDWFHKAINNKIAKAYYYVGKYCMDGKIAQKNEVRGIELYEIAAKLNDEDAQYALYKYYEKKGSAKESIKNLMLAADNGHVDAQFELAQKYETGIEIEQSSSKAMEYYELAANQEHADAQFRLAICMLNSEVQLEFDEHTPVYWMTQSSKNGNVSAAYELGKWYEEGREGVVIQDYKESFRAYFKAGNRGHTISQYKVGYAYEHGLGTPKGLKAATDWYQKAAKTGHKDALYSLGKMLKNGLGIPKDEAKAYECFKVATERKHIEATYEFALMNINQDPKLYLDLMQTVAAQGSVNANYTMGMLYKRENCLVQQDRQKACFHLKQASMKNHIEAQLELANLYEEDKEYEKARNWYIRVNSTESLAKAKAIEKILNELNNKLLAANTKESKDQSSEHVPAIKNNDDGIIVALVDEEQNTSDDNLFLVNEKLKKLRNQIINSNSIEALAMLLDDSEAAELLQKNENLHGIYIAQMQTLEKTLVDI